MIVVLLKQAVDFIVLLYKEITKTGIKMPWKKDPVVPATPAITVVAPIVPVEPLTPSVLAPSIIPLAITHNFTIPASTTGITGTDFGNSILHVAPDQTREDAIYEECVMGNLPNFMRNAQPVTVTVAQNKLTYWVLPDVLCIGTDTDYLRTPLNPLTARRVGDLFNAALPTKKMAQQIWAAAPVKLSPIPNGPPYDETMQTSATMIAHNAKIQKALGITTVGQLVTGHKKDVVMCTHLLQDSSRVAIYGWFYPTGQAIQGLNPVSHDKFYKDYSHGIRMVCRTMTLNGTNVDYFDLLKNPAYASMISDEGAFDASHIYTA